jgi:hypothetical protein
MDTSLKIKEQEHHGLLTDVEGSRDPGDESRLRPAWLSGGRSHKAIVFVLLTSIVVNLLFLFLFLFPPTAPEASDVEPPSKYAHLRRNREEPYVVVTEYSTANESYQNQLWHDINVDSAVVALSDEWAAQHDLRTAQRFPWDQSKGIYILHGFHNLHCLKIIYIALSEFRIGHPQTRSWHHVSHCVDALRRQILCDADDTPRATDRREEVVSGVHQHRKCRSWDELEAFAKRHTACYKRPENPESDPHSKLDRFKHCPPDSGYVVTDDYKPTDELIVGLPEESLDLP